MNYQLLCLYSGNRNLIYPILLGAGVFQCYFFFRCVRVCQWEWDALQEWSVCEHDWILPVSVQ